MHFIVTIKLISGKYFFYKGEFENKVTAIKASLDHLVTCYNFIDSMIDSITCAESCDNIIEI